MKKVALITGITGQDGSYLAELLLEKNYVVHGIIRRNSSSNFERISQIISNKKYEKRFFLHEGDLSDYNSLNSIIKSTRPSEIYNLAAMSHVHTSFKMPEYAADVNGFGVLRLLEAIKDTDPTIKFYQASTSELFGKVLEIPQTEKTPFYPRSPYGISKLFGYWMTVNYREAYNIFACNGILFNHESPRRGVEFVSRKITLGAARIKLGRQKTIVLGNLNSKRDWGFAKDYVEGMWLMLQQEKPDDFVLATGKTYQIRDFVKLTFQELGYEIIWQGEGLSEKGIDKKTGETLIEISPEYFRGAEVDILLGDPSKAKKNLGWSSKTSIEELVKMMVKSDFEAESRSSQNERSSSLIKDLLEKSSVKK